MNSVLPSAVTAALELVADAARHPGLQLDKFQAPPAKMEHQKHTLLRVGRAKGDPDLLKDLLTRHDRIVAMAEGRSFVAVTATPLTLHLARAGTNENAGLSLHPVHGFAWLPASGLKGLARAYAETRWLPDQSDPAMAWAIIGRVFGRGSETDRGKSWRPAGEFPETGSGRVVFHDAWPTTWPRLVVDIANNHHPSYYRDPGTPPGDWDNPSPVYFLAVPAGTGFSFSVCPVTSSDASDADLAASWLRAALVHAGAGAKTSAGYGVFRLADDDPPVAPVASERRLEATLSLVTPAFLAGAEQNPADCDLRPATLRGVLRWWWRTLHSAHLETSNLKRLEAAIWGDTRQGSGVRIVVEPVGGPGAKPKPFDPNQIAGRLGLRGRQRHDRVRGQRGRPAVLGLEYGSYGMTAVSSSRSPAGNRPARQYLDDGASWRLVVTARDVRLGAAEGGSRGAAISADQVLSEAKSALWLLARFGGVGSKSRKGYGCLEDLELPGIAGLNDIRRTASALRDALRMPPAARPAAPASPSIDSAITAEIPLPARSGFDAVHEVGALMQDFRRDGGLAPDQRAVLGLPGRGRDSGPRGARHAAPAHLHVAKRGKDYRLRVTAFPVSTLFGSDADAQRATVALQKLADFYAARALSPTTTGPRQPGPRRASGAARSGHPQHRRAGSLVGRRGSYEGEPAQVIEDNVTKIVIRFGDGEDMEVLRDSFELED